MIDRPDVTKALVHERGQLNIRVVGATCTFGELAQPVSLDPLEVSARLCNVELKKKRMASAHFLRSKAMGFYELSIPFRFSVTTWTFSSFAIAMKERRCTMSYFPINSSGSGLKMSNFAKVVIGPYQDSGGILQIGDVETVKLCGRRELASQLSQPNSVACLSNNDHLKL